jgi:hypothetical protein
MLSTIYNDQNGDMVRILPTNVALLASDFEVIRRPQQHVACRSVERSAKPAKR